LEKVIKRIWDYFEGLLARILHPVSLYMLTLMPPRPDGVLGLRPVLGNMVLDSFIQYCETLDVRLLPPFRTTALLRWHQRASLPVFYQRLFGAVSMQLWIDMQLKELQKQLDLDYFDMLLQKSSRQEDSDKIVPLLRPALERAELCYSHDSTFIQVLKSLVNKQPESPS
jgi:hypothetical protein